MRMIPVIGGPHDGEWWEMAPCFTERGEYTRHGWGHDDDHSQVPYWVREGDNQSNRTAIAKERLANTPHADRRDSYTLDDAIKALRENGPERALEILLEIEDQDRNPVKKKKGQKLSWAQVQEIRADDDPQWRIAYKYNISASYVSAIKRGKARLNS